jgi:hypothetical protein
MPPRGTQKGTKRARQYEHIRDSLVERGSSEDEAAEIAARTVNKERARSGEAKISSRRSREDISSGRRGGIRRTAVFLDSDSTRALGLDVRSPDGRHRFLPWVAAELDGQGVDIRSAFLLVDAGDSYTRRGARGISDRLELASLRVDDEGRVGNGVVSIAHGAGTHGR